MLLTELVEQVVELADLLERRGRLAVAERLLAAHPLAAFPPEVGPQRAQVVGERLHLPGECAVTERLRHQARQLLALLRRQRAHQPLPRRGPPGQRVDQLVHVGRLLREVVAVPPHELGELVGGVLTAGVPFEQGVEVAQHLGDGLLGGGVGQPLLEAGEPLFHDLAP